MTIEQSLKRQSEWFDTLKSDPKSRELLEQIESKFLHAEIGYMNGKIFRQLESDINWAGSLEQAFSEVIFCLDNVSNQSQRLAALKIAETDFWSESKSCLATKLSFYLLGFAIKQVFSVSIMPVLGVAMAELLDNKDGAWCGTKLSSFELESSGNQTEMENKQFSTYGVDSQTFSRETMTEIGKDLAASMTNSVANGGYNALHNAVGDRILKVCEGSEEVKVKVDNLRKQQAYARTQYTAQIQQALVKWVHYHLVSAWSKELEVPTPLGQFRTALKPNPSCQFYTQAVPYLIPSMDYIQCQLNCSVKDEATKRMGAIQSQLSLIRKINLLDRAAWEFFRLQVERMFNGQLKWTESHTMSTKMKRRLESLMDCQWQCVDYSGYGKPSDPEQLKKDFSTCLKSKQQFIEAQLRRVARYSDISALKQCIEHLIEKVNESKESERQHWILENIEEMLADSVIKPEQVKKVWRESHTFSSKTDKVWLLIMYVQYMLSTAKYIEQALTTDLTEFKSKASELVVETLATQDEQWLQTLRRLLNL